MRWTIAGLVFVGLVAAVAAAVLAVTLRADFGMRPGAKPSEEVEVLVASRALQAMTTIDSTAIARETVRRDAVLPKAVTNSSNIIGRVLVTPVMAGQQFTSSQFASSDSGVQLAAVLPEGYRAMSIKLSNDTGIDEVLFPGCMVDVVASFRLQAVGGSSNSGEIVSVTMLQGIQVLGVDNRTITAPEQSEVVDSTKRERKVILKVNTEQAEALQLAVTHGEVTVAMRNPLDTALVNATGTRMSDLSKDLDVRLRKLLEEPVSSIPLTLPEVSRMGAGSAPAGQNPGAATASGAPQPAAFQPPAPALPVWTTTVYRGRVKEVQKFTLPEEPEAQ